MEGSDTITPVLFQSYNFQASFPAKLTKTNFWDLCHVSSFWAWAALVLVGPVESHSGTEDSAQLADHGREAMGPSHNEL